MHVMTFRTEPSTAQWPHNQKIPPAYKICFANKNKTYILTEMKLTEYIKHTKNGIQCEFARNQTLRMETGARRNLALLTLYFAFLL